jgi:hypothetical protein
MSNWPQNHERFGMAQKFLSTIATVLRRESAVALVNMASSTYAAAQNHACRIRVASA